MPQHPQQPKSSPLDNAMLKLIEPQIQYFINQQRGSPEHLLSLAKALFAAGIHIVKQSQGSERTAEILYVLADELATENLPPPSDPTISPRPQSNA